MGIPVIAVVSVMIGGPYLCLGWEHYEAYGLHAAAQGMLLFLCINLIVCLWELCLCYRYDLIRSTHLKRVKDGQVGPLCTKQTILFCIHSRHRITWYSCLSKDIDLLCET